MRKIKFGASTIINVYHVLESYKGDIQNVNKALIQTIVMFCEALRFVPIFEEIKKMLETGDTLILPPVVWSWVNNWHVLSQFALDCKYLDEQEVFIDNPALLIRIKKFQVYNRTDIACLMGLITRKKV